MKLKWTSKAASDLSRLYEFVSTVNKRAAIDTLRSLTHGPELLTNNPRLGEQLFQFQPREVRRIHIGNYELRYEIQQDTVYILRIWHTRENR